MDQIERRAFMKGAGSGALAFTVGGVEVLLTPGAARTQGVPFRLLNANEAETIEALGETLVPGARKAGIAHFIDQQICSAGGGGAAAGAHLQRASAVCEFLSRRHRRGRPRQRQVTTAVEVRDAVAERQRDFVNACGRTRSKAGRAQPEPFVYAVLRSDAVDVVYGTMEGYAALGIPYMPTSRQTEEVVTWRTKKLMSSSSAPARPARCMHRVLAKAGKKVVVLEAGPDWQLSDLISSEFWGRRIKPAGAPVPARRQESVRLRLPGRLGRGRCGAALLRQFPALSAERLTRSRASTTARTIGRSPIEDVAPFYDKVAADIGMSGDAKAEEKWRPAGQAYPMPPMKTFRNGEIWLKGFECSGIRMVPAPVAMNSTEYKGRPACIYDGWCHVGCPIGALANPTVTYLSEARKAKAEVRALCTVTRVLTNAPGHQGHRRRVLRRQKRAPGAGGERRRARRVGGAELRASCSTRRPTSTRRGSPIRTVSSANT